MSKAWDVLSAPWWGISHGDRVSFWPILRDTGLKNSCGNVSNYNQRSTHMNSIMRPWFGIQINANINKWYINKYVCIYTHTHNKLILLLLLNYINLYLLFIMHFKIQFTHNYTENNQQWNESHLILFFYSCWFFINSLDNFNLDFHISFCLLYQISEWITQWDF